MKASDLYYMLAEEEDMPGFYLVSKDYWEEHVCIDDHSFGKEIWKIIPEWDRVNDGFAQETESYFEYFTGGKRKPSEGIKYIQSLGIQQVVWGHKDPLAEPTEPEDSVEELLEACVDALQFAKHPDFGKPELLIKRIKKYLGENLND